MSANFTPGPWEANGTAIETVREPSYVVAHVFGDVSDIDEATAESNAALIAAAPDLLSCLKAAIDIIGHPDDRMTKLFVSTVARAEGGA